jgi:hypothetical protein
MSRTVAFRAGAALVAAGVAFACGRIPSGSAVAPNPTAPRAGEGQAPAVATADRLIVRTGEQTVIVDSPVDLGRHVERMVIDAGGYLERVTGRSDGDVEVVGRVPATQLAPIMDSVALLGIERRRHITGSDVTDQHADLEARIRSTTALRDRIQQLLARATTLDEILTLERQIARLQTEIDGLQARLDQLNSQAELASLAVTLQRERVLGPVSIAGRGIARFFASLFVKS